MTRRRLDAELVRRGLAPSREQGRLAIDEGRVSVAGVTATKAATQVDEAAAIEIRVEPESDYVSRGAYKLIGALDAFGAGGAAGAGALPGLSVDGALALDAGASTGGFTQVLLERGAQRVIAADVGYGQLAWRLRSDERVNVLERTNVRHLDRAGHELPYSPNLIVADLSFISLTVVLASLIAVAADRADFVLMVKPQFEVGKERVGSGVVTSPRLRAEAVTTVADCARHLGLEICGVVASPLPGPKGNVEYFLWMTKVARDVGAASEDDAGMDEDALHAAILRAVEEGPQ